MNGNHGALIPVAADDQAQVNGNEAAITSSMCVGMSSGCAWGCWGAGHLIASVMQNVGMPSSSKPLNVFRDLRLLGPIDAIERLRDALVASAKAPWRNAPEREKRLQVPAPDGRPMAFERSATPGYEAAGLVLFARPDGLEVTNIVPLERSELSHRAYNMILEDFAEQIARPASRATGFEVKLSVDAVQIEDMLSPAAAEALRRFSALANKSTGAAHPLDRQRWFDFIIQAHQDHSDLDADFLHRWLLESDDWPQSRASDLAIEYERSRALLTRYEEIS